MRSVTSKINSYVVFILFFYSSIFYTLVLKDFYRANDLIGNISGLNYIKESILSAHIFAQWIPYVNQGLPLTADPLSAFYNPVVLFSALFLSLDTAVKFLFFLSFFFSGMSFYLFARYLKISVLISLLSAMLYISSGFLLARIVAGHFELILTFPLIPLFYLFIVRLVDKQNFLNVFMLSVAIALFLFSGAVYLFYYAYIIIYSLIIYFLIKSFIRKKHLFRSIALWFFASSILTLSIASVKLLPMLESNNLLIKAIDPFSGSQNIISFTYNLFLPFNLIYEKLNLSEFLNSPYPWWESFAFLGFLAILGTMLFLVNIKKIKFIHKELILFLILIIFLFSQLGYSLNPMHILVENIEILQKFRIPSRIYSFITPLLLIISVLYFDFLFKRKNKLLQKTVLVFFLVCIIFNTFYYIQIFNTKSLKPLNKDFSLLIDYLNESDSDKNYYIAQSSLFEHQLPQQKLIDSKIKILNSNYGFILKNSSVMNYIDIDFYRNRTKYYDIYPKYFIYPCSIPPSKIFDADLIRVKNDACLFKNRLYTPYVYIKDKESNEVFMTQNKQLINYKITFDSIEARIETKDEMQKLVIVESNYPGWNLTIDGIPSKLGDGKYLEADLLNGNHVYKFTFRSKSFILGLVISFLTLLISIFIIFKIPYKAI